jgi:histidyl-tRNA synthetase
VGFALGIERIMELVKMPESKREGYYLGAMEDEAVDLLFSLASKKRATDKVTIEYSAKKLKAHLKGADRANARYCAVIGEDERVNKTIWIKDLVEKKEKIIPINSF